MDNPRYAPTNQRYAGNGLSELADQLDQIYWTLPPAQGNFPNASETDFRQADISDKNSGSKKRSYHFPESAALKTGNADIIEGEWRPIEIDMMRLCSHRFTTLLAKQRSYQSKHGISAPGKSSEDDITPLTDEWIPNDHRFFAVVLLEKFSTLRDLARHEDWGPDMRFLRLYLDHTFRRVSELSRTQRTLLGYYPSGSNEPTHACFNTGLLTRNVEKLYACFHLNSRSNDSPGASSAASSSSSPQHPPPRWFLYGFQTESQLISPAKMKVYHGTSEFNSNMLPQRVFYHNSPSDLVFDPSIPIESRVELAHLFGDIQHEAPSQLDRRQRLPAKYHRLGLGDLASKFYYALGRLKTLLEDQPRMAVPQFFRDKHLGGRGEMQLMCPLCLDPETPNTVDCAVVIRRVSNRAGDFYQPVTILSREMVFIHSRLVAKPDQLWLLEFMAPPKPTVETPAPAQQAAGSIGWNHSSPVAPSAPPLTNQDQQYQHISPYPQIASPAPPPQQQQTQHHQGHQPFPQQHHHNHHPHHQHRHHYHPQQQHHQQQQPPQQMPVLAPSPAAPPNWSNAAQAPLIDLEDDYDSNSLAPHSEPFFGTDAHPGRRGGRRGGAQTADMRLPRALRLPNPQIQERRAMKQQQEMASFSYEELAMVPEILTSALVGTSADYVELASLAPHLKARIPRLNVSKGLCKSLVLAAAENGLVVSQIRGKQTYISLPQQPHG